MTRALFLGGALLLGACDDAPDAPPPSDPPDVDVPHPEAVGPDTTRLQADPTAASGPAESDRAHTAPPEAVALSEAPTPADGRRALLVGIDDYPGDDADLPSGAADVRAMRDLLVSHYGYRPEHVVVLRDREATRGAIRRAVRDHLGAADASALLYVSGHGVRLGANAGRRDPEADDRDEALYVWADDGAHSSLIVDDEVGAWMGALGADRVTVVLDACHSGTGARAASDAPPVKEALLASVEARLDPAAPWRRPAPAASGPVLLLSAAADDEQAYAGLDGAPSLFTRVLVATLPEAAPDQPLAEAMGTVARRVRVASANIGTAHTPQVEGDRGDTLAEIFGRR